MIEGWYYLHTNGQLIYKRELGETAADIRESSFAVMLWSFEKDDRAKAWQILVEALALKGDYSRIMELADKWGCDDSDAVTYAEYIGVKLSMDGNKQCATRKDFINLQESPAGFGTYAIEALAELCKNLGYKAQKIWGASFHDLVRVK